MATLSKEQILKARDCKTKTVPVKEWGGDVKLQTMSGAARDQFDSVLVAAKGGAIENIRALYLSLCIVDDAGELVFTAEEVGALGKKSSKVLDGLFIEAQNLNSIGDDAVENAEKN